MEKMGGRNMMIKCFKCDTVLILTKSLWGYKMCECGNLHVDNTINETYADEWRYIAIKKDIKQEIWRNII
tara:strand:- start:6588 stop:6797 length:210 start_codon:yes stop_codon:yes gene_type:complete